jgi:hypothetical protein
VTRDAPIEVIKAAYRVIAQKHHPDMNQSEDSQRIMTIVNEAWRILSDPKLKEEHDAWIDQQEREHLKEQSENIYSTVNFDASERGKSATSQNENSVKKTEDIKNIIYARPLLVWVFIFAGMLIVGLVVENEKISKEFDTKDSARTSLRDSEDRKVEEANAASSRSEKEVNLVPKPEKKYKESGIEDAPEAKRESAPFNPEAYLAEHPAPSPKEQLKFEPIKLPHGYISGEPIIAVDGISKFTVDNSQADLDADVRLYKEDVQVRAFNVQSGKTFTANDISPGSYKLRYRVFLGGKFRVFEVINLFDITQSTEDTYERKTTIASHMRVTLYKVKNGNVSVKEIDPSKF